VNRDATTDNTTHYYYDGWRVLTETNQNSAVQRQFAYGNYLDEVLLMVDSSNDDHYYAHDHLYSPVTLIAASGAIEEYVHYDAYGAWFDSDDTPSGGAAASAQGNPYTFTGQRLDSLDNGDLSLLYYKNRYYSTNYGRFHNRDQIRYIDGMNLYRYVNSRPIYYTDPLGLLCEISV